MDGYNYRTMIGVKNLNFHPLEKAIIVVVIAPDALALDEIVVKVFAFALVPSVGSDSTISTPSSKTPLKWGVIQGAQSPEVEVTNSLLMLVEEEEVGGPNEPFVTIGIIGDIIRRIGIDIAIQEIHLLIDCLPHLRKLPGDVDA